MNYLKSLTAITGFSILSMVSPAMAAVTIPDYSFETPGVGGGYTYRPSVTGVTFLNNAGVAGGTFSGAGAPDGSQYGFVQSGGGESGFERGAISFDVTGLTAGATYNLTFFGSQRPGYNPNPLQVSFDSTMLGTFTASSAFAFEAFTTTSFVAAGTTGSLNFLGTVAEGDTATALDNISINSTDPVVAAVPEPATWMTMLLGFGLVGFAMRRRQTRVTNVSYAR